MQAFIFPFKWITDRETAEGDSVSGKGPMRLCRVLRKAGV